MPPISMRKTPRPLQLRAMNIIYETTKERGGDDPDSVGGWWTA